MTKVYVLDISSLEVEFYKKRMPTNFLSEAKKYKDSEQFKRSFFSWYLLADILKDSGFAVENIKIEYNEYKKPRINNLFFNISHSLNFVVVVLSNEDVGVDIEYIAKKDNNKLARRILNDEELERYLKNKDYFYKIWTKKEAEIKRLGLGVTIKLLKEISADADTYEIKDKEQNRYFVSISPKGSKINHLKSI